MQKTPAQRVDDPSVWMAKDFGSARSWAHPLPPASQDEIEAAVHTAAAAGKTFTNVGLADFPLPKTRALLRDVFNDLEDGRGFSVVVRLSRRALQLRRSVDRLCRTLVAPGEAR